MLEKIRRRVYEILEIAEPEDRVSVVFDAFLFILIMLNIFTVVIGSVESIRVNYANYLYGFKLFSIIVFVVELTLRIWVSNYCTNQCDSTIYNKTPVQPFDISGFISHITFLLTNVHPPGFKVYKDFPIV